MRLGTKYTSRRGGNHLSCCAYCGRPLGATAEAVVVGDSLSRSDPGRDHQLGTMITTADTVSAK